ncbi:unnamed protein product [Orchesella dallaii]|uniref:Uncharacterized protein n=1 Tax=Orchesella dallaii TaxID=48710 RepID=A0ABP1QMN4_9HEXA
MKFLANAENGKSTDKGNEDESITKTDKFLAKWAIPLSLVLFVILILAVALLNSDPETNLVFTNKPDTNNGAQAQNNPKTSPHSSTFDHSSTFPKVNFKPGGKPDKEFWDSVKPTVQFDDHKPNCWKRADRFGCMILSPGKAAEDKTCTFFIFKFNGIIQQNNYSFVTELRILGNIICDVLASVDKALEVPSFIHPHPRKEQLTIYNFKNEKEHEAFKDATMSLKWAKYGEIDYVNGNYSGAELEAKVGSFSQFGEIKFTLQLEGMEEGISEMVLKAFEQAQSMGFRLLEVTLTSCSKEDHDYSIVEYTFVNVNYWWDYLIPIAPKHKKIEDK